MNKLDNNLWLSKEAARFCCESEKKANNYFVYIYTSCARNFVRADQSLFKLLSVFATIFKLCSYGGNVL